MAINFSLSDISKSKWKKLTIAAAVIGGGLVGGLAWSANTTLPLLSSLLGFTIGGGVFSLLVALLGSVNMKLNIIRQEMVRSRQSLRAMVNIRPLLDGPPLDYSGWSVDPYLGKVLAQEIARLKPIRAVECGSGTSTVLMAQLLKQADPSSSVTALEHLPEYACKTRQLIQDHSLSTHAEVVTTPLQKWEVEGQTMPWYGVDLEHFSKESIDLVLVDGPPADVGSLARYPAAFILEPYLSAECVIIMDDGDRPDERQAAQRWAKLLNATLEHAGGPQGVSILRRES